jgi:hypothetical protein
MILKRSHSAQAMAVIVGVALVDIAVGALVGRLEPAPPLVVLGTAGGLAASAAAAGLLSWFRAWRATGLLRPARPASLLWFTPLLTYALLPLAQGPRVTLAVAGLSVIFALSIAFWKFAGLALALLLLAPLGRWRAAGLAALSFGLVHLLALLAGAALGPTLMNALASGLLGFGVSALALRTELMWPAVALYGLLLFGVAVTGGLEAPAMAPSVEAMLPALATSGLLAAVGVGALATGPRGAARASGLAES